MRLIAIIVVLALPGCTGIGRGVRIEAQRIEIPVPVPCLSAVIAPPSRMIARPDNVARALDLAVAKLVELLGPRLDGEGGYVGKTQGAMLACVKLER